MHVRLPATIFSCGTLCVCTYAETALSDPCRC
jgi:hypothetical protein